MEYNVMLSRKASRGKIETKHLTVTVPDNADPHQHIRSYVAETEPEWTLGGYAPNTVSAQNQ